MTIRDFGADGARNNAFGFRADDPTGYGTPPGSHIRRCNPRDSDVAGVVRLHRMIRRGTAYGPLLPEGVMEDDGADRGLMFAFVGAHLKRQFEFVQSEWINGGEFLGLGDAQDPVAGGGNTGSFTIRGGHCRGGSRDSQGSSPPAAANTLSCRDWGRSAGWAVKRRTRNDRHRRSDDWREPPRG